MLEAADWYIRAGLLAAVGFALLSQAEDVVAAWRQEPMRKWCDERLAARCRECLAHELMEMMIRRLAAGEKLDASAEIGADGSRTLVLNWDAEDGEPVEPLDPEDAVEEAERLLRGEI